MRDDLPPLPLGEYMGHCNGVPSYRYTVEQVHAYARIAVSHALERAAQACDAHASAEGIAQRCAAEIRAMKGDSDA